MDTLRKLVISVGAWLITVLVVSVVLQFSVGRPMPSLASLITLVSLMPFWLRVWGVQRTRTFRAVWLTMVALTVGLVGWLFVNVA